MRLGIYNRSRRHNLKFQICNVRGLRRAHVWKYTVGMSDTISDLKFQTSGTAGGGRFANCAGYFRDGILHVELVEFFGDAKVHDDEEIGAAGAFGGWFVCHAFLHPDCAGADLNCGFDDFGDKF